MNSKHFVKYSLLLSYSIIGILSNSEKTVIGDLEHNNYFYTFSFIHQTFTFHRTHKTGLSEKKKSTQNDFDLISVPEVKSSCVAAQRHKAVVRIAM